MAADAAPADGNLADASAYAANRSISLNGTSQFASTGNTGINVGLPVTYEAWAYTGSTSPTALQRIVVSERLTTNAYTPLQIQISPSGVWQCVFTNSSPQPIQQVNLNTNVTVAANTWTHLALAPLRHERGLLRQRSSESAAKRGHHASHDGQGRMGDRRRLSRRVPGWRLLRRLDRRGPSMVELQIRRRHQERNEHAALRWRERPEGILEARRRALGRHVTWGSI